MSEFNCVSAADLRITPPPHPTPPPETRGDAAKLPVCHRMAWGGEGPSGCLGQELTISDISGATGFCFQDPVSCVSTGL